MCSATSDLDIYRQQGGAGIRLRQPKLLLQISDELSRALISGSQGTAKCSTSFFF